MRISDWSSDVCSSDLPVTLQQARLMTVAGRRSVASVPLLDRGLPVGVLTLERGIDEEEFDARDLLIAETIAALAAPTIAHKQREERRIGGRIRRHSLDGAKALFGPRRPQAQIGRAHVSTPVTNAHLVCR